MDVISIPVPMFPVRFVRNKKQSCFVSNKMGADLQVSNAPVVLSRI